MTILIYAIARFADLLVLLLFVRAILSWFVNPYTASAQSALARINMFIVRLTEPLVSPCRKLLRRLNTGMFDFSVLLAMLFIMVARGLLIRILSMFLYM